MQNMFTCEPEAQSMVTQPLGLEFIALLCIECGWEGTAKLPESPWVVFRRHACRMRAEQVSRYS
jgi:hypothetical protein